jgi:hypothetical protein
MKLEKRHIEKVDSHLRDALSQADEEEVLRAVMVLRPEGNPTEKGEAGEELDPSQFPTRKSYRQALIDQRQLEISDDVGETLQALHGLSLAPRGGTIGRVVVVEGPARQIVSSLDLPGVYHVSLDRPIKLIEPRRRGRRESNR